MSSQRGGRDVDSGSGPPPKRKSVIGGGSASESFGGGQSSPFPSSILSYTNDHVPDDISTDKIDRLFEVPNKISRILYIKLVVVGRMIVTLLSHELLTPYIQNPIYTVQILLSFQMWTNQMQDTLNSKKKGDVAFRHKDFRVAIDCYTQFIDVGTMKSPTIYARRSLSYVMSDMPQEALSDAVQAQVISPVWHIASYLQASALFALGRDNEAQIALKEGSILEEKNTTTS